MRRLALAVLLAWSAPSFGLVITEIMYNQPGSAEDLEFIELYNEKVTPEDLSGYRFTRGIRYQFPTAYQANGRPVASLAPGGYLVLASDAARFQEHYGFAPFGQYFGRLSNSGERIVLENDAGDPFDAEFPENTAGRREGARIIDFAYNDTGQWPVACDGTGHTLCLIDPFRSQSCPTNWTASPTLWGTPGQPNGLEDQWIETELFPAGTQWRYIKGTSEPPSTWKDRTFNDTGWSVGAAPIGYGPHGHATDLSDMPGNYASFYARRAFSVANPSQVQGLALYVNWDDGFVAYINGQEVARENVTGTPPAHDTFAGSPTNPMGLIAFDISAVTGLLVAGTNVIAIQTHNVGHTSSDAFMDARLASRRLITAGGGDGALVINEVHYNTLSGRYVELYNASPTPVPLAGYYLTTDPSNLLAYPLTGEMAGRGYLAVPENPALSLALPGTLPPDDPDDPPATGRVRVFLSYATGSDTAVVAAEAFSDALEFGWSMGRIPDGGATWRRLSVPTQGSANVLSPGDVHTDVIFNEIMYHPFREENPFSSDDDGLAGDNLGYIELYNRGTAPVDLTGWRITRGVNYTFPEGAIIPAGGYVVVAKNPARIQQVYGVTAFGPYEGRLSFKGEELRLRDAKNNIANEIRYYDGGRWDKWADGLGSSLELIDPYQDNSFPSAWKASDESGKSEWATITYSGVHRGSAWPHGVESEFHMHLMGRGEILLDELQFSEHANFSTNRVRGGSFNAPSDYTSNWIKSDDTGGTHIDSRWTGDDAFSGAGCLRIVASGRGDTGFNRLECATTVALTAGQTYHVRYRARWLRGNNLVMTRTHGQGVARVNAVPVPERLGTPGARNSMFMANQGPVHRNLSQDPVVPNGGQPVKVTVEIQDGDGVAAAVIRYRQDTQSTYATATMNDSGTDGDAVAGDGVWTGTIPGQPAGSVMEFYVEATDFAARTTQCPPLPEAGAPPTELKNLAVYRVGDKQVVSGRPLYRITLTRDAHAALAARRTFSNHLVPCSFVLNEKQIFYNCGQRFRGSPFIRRGGLGFSGSPFNGIRVRFPADDQLLGALKEINLDGSGHTNQRDRTAYYLQRKVMAATLGVQSCWSWGSYVNARFKAGPVEVNQVYDHLQKVDGDYLEYWWRGNDDGLLYKVDDWFEWNNTGGFSNWQGDMIYRGEDKETSYRNHFKIRSRGKDDDYAQLIELTRVMTTLSGAELDEAIRPLMDVRQWSVILACRLFIDDWDTLGARRGKNAYVYLPSPHADGTPETWKLIPWDSDLTFGNTGAQIYPEGHFPQMQKLWQRPWARRMINADYRYLIAEVIEPTRLNAWITWIASSAGIGGTDIPQWCQNRATNVLGRLPSDASAPFRITEPVGDTFVTPVPEVTIRGSAPANMDLLLVNGVDITAGLEWATATEWVYTGALPLQIDVPEDLVFTACRRDGLVIATAALRVLYTTREPPRITSIWPEEGIAIGGETVTLRGTNFEPGILAKFGAVTAQDMVFVSATELRVTSPPHPAGAVTISVENPDGLPGFWSPFTYIPIPPPRITHLEPALGHTTGGTRVKIRGQYFQQGVRVTFGGTQSPSVQYTDLGEITAVTPARSSGAVDVRVLNLDGQSFTLAGAFTYVNTRAPRIDAVTPAEGPRAGGTLITITGADFRTGAAVWVGNRPATQVTVVSGGELTARTPAEVDGHTFVSVRVVNTDGQYAWLPSAFRYVSGVMSCNPGDANGDGLVNIADAVAILDWLFQGKDSVRCERAADVNGDARIDIADVIWLFQRLFPES